MGGFEKMVRDSSVLLFWGGKGGHGFWTGLDDK